MKILVTGGTGTVGSSVVQELLARDVEISVLTRSEESAKKLPQGVNAVIGNLAEPDDVLSAFSGMDGLFLLNAVGPTETHEGLMAVCGARLAGIKRIVYLSVHHADGAPWLPHFGAKIAVETALKKSGIPHTILRPNNFFQNDYWFKDIILNYGVYPAPIGDAGVSRVDVRDIAEAAAITLTTDGHDGETYNLVGPTLETGQSAAATWSTVLGKTVAYGGNNLDAWAKQVSDYYPAWMVFDLKLMFEFFQQEGLKAPQEDLDRLTKLLGRPPRNFEDFAKETAAMWQA